MDQKRLAELLEEATVDCYDEEEEFSGVFSTLADNLDFPLQARTMGNTVEMVGLDGNQSSPRRGILAIVRQGEQKYLVGLAELEFIDPDPVSAEWLAVYRYWLGE
jgi:hypothetical protein